MKPEVIRSNSNGSWSGSFLFGSFSKYDPVRTPVPLFEIILYSRLRAAGMSGRIALEETHGRRIACGICDHWHRRIVLHPGGVGRAERERSRSPHRAAPDRDADADGPAVPDRRQERQG